MPLWVSLIEANYDMRRYAASGDAGKRLISALPVVDVAREWMTAVSVLDLKQKRRRAERGEVGGKDGRKKEKRESFQGLTDRAKTDKCVWNVSSLFH